MPELLKMPGTDWGFFIANFPDRVAVSSTIDDLSGLAGQKRLLAKPLAKGFP